MRKIAVFFTLLFLQVPLSGHAVVNGQELTNEEKKSLLPVVLVGLDGSFAGYSQGMAVHIGNGLLLTAWHVAHAFKTPPKLLVYDTSQNEIAKLKPEQYKVTSPPAIKYIETTNFKIPIPDLALIIPPADIRAVIAKKLPTMQIHQDLNNFDPESLYAIGAGLESFDSNDATFGNLKIGQIALEAYDDTQLSSVWKPGNKTSALRGGDSGTPLLFKNSNGSYSIIGITSIGTTPQKFKEVGASTNYFSRLDSTDIQNWIQQNLSNFK